MREEREYFCAIINYLRKNDGAEISRVRDLIDELYNGRSDASKDAESSNSYISRLFTNIFCIKSGFEKILDSKLEEFFDEDITLESLGFDSIDHAIFNIEKTEKYLSKKLAEWENFREKEVPLYNESKHKELSKRLKEAEKELLKFQKVYKEKFEEIVQICESLSIVRNKAGEQEKLLF